MANATATTPENKPDPASDKPARPKRLRRGYKRLKDVPPEKGIPLDKALRMFKEADVENLTSFSSVRRAFHEKKIPGFTHGKNRIYFETNAVLEIVGAATATRTTKTIDQTLLGHYRESEFNNPFTAVEARISPTLAKAIQVFNDYHLAMQNPLIAASERGRLTQKMNGNGSNEPRQEPPEPSCRGCSRTFSTAQADHERVNRDATGGRASLDIAEEHALREFQGIKCSECWMWRAHAPILVMRERLQELGRSDEKIATPKSVPTTHPPAGSGTNADGERNTHRGPAT